MVVDPVRPKMLFDIDRQVNGDVVYCKKWASLVAPVSSILVCMCKRASEWVQKCEW